MTAHEGRQLLSLPAAELRPNPRQPRQVFDPEGLAELSESVRQHGILQPLTVRKTAQGWELIAGERRLRAAKLAGLETVPCIETEADEETSALLALVENLQRRDLHYFEEAAAISEYLLQTGCSQEEAASRLGRSPSALANKLRLLRLSPACREALVTHNLTERHARALLRLKDDAAQLNAVQHIVRHQLNVAQTEQYIEKQLSAVQRQPHRRTFIMKDVRLFLNSLDRGLRLVREAGVDARTERQDTEDAILLTIRIPKRQK